MNLYKNKKNRQHIKNFLRFRIKYLTYITGSKVLYRMNIFILLPYIKYKEWKRERKIYCEQGNRCDRLYFGSLTI